MRLPTRGSIPDVGWTMLYLFVALKIPIVAAIWLVYWAIKQEPDPSEDVRDVSFPSAEVGYALDASGGLFRTSSGGAAWKTLDPGTTARARGCSSTTSPQAVSYPERSVFRAASVSRSPQGTRTS